MNSKIISFAIEAHQKVNHLYDGKPYSVHLSMVAMYALKYIDLIPDSQHQNMMNAAWLHDTIEDCRLTYNDIKEVAGFEVAEIVFALTNEKGKTRKERANSKYYSDILNVPFARFVKICDRLANVKYSKDTKSRMFEMCQKENEGFIESLISAGSDRRHYQPMIDELSRLIA
jgi:(p)ppGpp synthase/HD superfamily hydrolase